MIARKAITPVVKPAPHEMSLEDKLKASLKLAAQSTGASMVPVAVAPPEKEEEVIPFLTDIVKDKTDMKRLAALISDERPWAEQEKAAKKARKPLTDAIKGILGKYGVAKAAWEGLTVNYFSSKPRETISEAKLRIALMTVGLQPDQINGVIAAATTVGKPTWTLRIGLDKDDEE